MPASFHKNGLHFQYPGNWKLEQDETDTGWTVLVQSPQTAFFMLTFDAGMPQPELMARTALETMRAEYQQLDADEALDSLAGQPACGYDIRFFSFDLTNTCWTRSFFAEGGTVLAMWQANDLELDAVEPVFRAIWSSLRLNDQDS
jgi:hypothetical protein